MIVNMRDKAKDLYYSNKKSGLKATNSQDAIDEVSGKVDQIAGDQIPQEYLEAAVDEYVKNNSAGFATKVELEGLDSQLSGEIVEINDRKKSKSLKWDIEWLKAGMNSSGEIIESTKYMVTKDILYSDKEIDLSLPSEYRVAVYYFGNTTRESYINNSGWLSAKYTIPRNSYFALNIRKNPASDFSDSEYVDLLNVLEFDYRIIKQPYKYTHFSIDDSVLWSDLIANKDVYTSAFDNPILGELKRLHDIYGACFSLYVFMENGDYLLENVPNKFRGDFANNKHWLRFGFHSQNSDVNYEVDDVDNLSLQYSKFVNSISYMTSATSQNSYDCIDTVVRLSNFKGSLNNVLALRDTYCGISGLLTADDTRTSYYLNSTQAVYLVKHSKYYDADNMIMFYKTQKRLEDETTDINNYGTLEFSNFKGHLEFFTHEQRLDSAMYEKLENYCKWLVANDYIFAFPMDLQ